MPSRPRHRLPDLAALAAATAIAAGTAGCTSPRTPGPGRPADTSGPTTTATPSTTASSTTTTTTPGPASTNGLRVGTYTDGPAGFPHYVVDVTSSTGDSVAGSISFVYQDGRTASAGTFSGRASGGRATLTIDPQGTAATATYTSTTLVLDSCTTYLQHTASAAQCTFDLTGTSPG